MAMDLEEYRKKLKERGKEIDMAFRGRYADELEALHGLSAAQLEAVTPGNPDCQTYAKLIAAVEGASATNVAEAELQKRIKALGETAVGIAKRVSGLAALLA